MDRQTIYAGQIPLETDQLKQSQNAMVGLAKLASTVLGSNTLVDGFTVTPTVPASLNVIVTPGEVYQLENLEASAWSSLPADTHTILKQGIILDPATFGIAPPNTVGYSQVFLIEVQYQDEDSGSTVLPYFNAASPSIPFAGPGNAGSAQNTVRMGVAALQVKAGIAAPTGTQAAPTADAGWSGLFIVTVANGATTITSGNITQLSTAPFLATNGKLPQIPTGVQNNTWSYAPDTGAVNAIIAAVEPAPTGLVPGLSVRIKVANTNTDQVTINLNGLGAVAVHRANGSALSPGDIAANMVVDLVYDGSAFQVLNFEGIAAATTTNNNTYVTNIPYATDSGAPSTLVASFTPAITSLSAGTTIEVKAANTNTGASTLVVNGLGAVPIVGLSGEPLQAGAIQANEVAMLIFNGTAFQLLARQMGLVNVQVITASGNYVPSAGANKALVFSTGGGGAGGSANPQGTGVGFWSGSGGESGTTAIALVNLSGVASIACTIGAGGVSAASGAPAGSQSGPGGQTSFGTYAIAPGGKGGYCSANGTITNTGTGGTPMSAATGLFIIASNPGDPVGGQVDTTVNYGGINSTAGAGGPSFWGGAGLGNSGLANANATGYGSGGGGEHGGPGVGGAGMQGVIFVLEF